MATRKNTFLLKRSNVAGNIPTAGQIQLGELALNTADVKLYASGTTTNSILPIGWDRISRTGDTMTGTLYAPTISATTYQNLPNDLPTAGTTGQILAKNSNTNYDVTWIDNYTSQLQHTVKAGVAISRGQAVYVTSANGTNMIVGLASNTSEATSSKTLGLLAQDLALNGIGFVVTEGLLAGLNTGSATAGDPVWLGTNGNLIFGLLNKPVAPAHLVYIGVVTRVQTVNGEIFVKPQNGFEFNELHDVLLTGVTNGDLVSYDSVSSLWKNSKTLNGSYNVTGALSATTISATSITAGSFTGNLTGTASLATSATTALNATNVGVTNNTTTNATYYLGFVSATSGNLPLQVDSNTLTFNPSTNILTLPNIVATGTITATTISATTYQNLPTDIRVTGGTYSTGTATFRNNTGGTFTVTGFNTGTITGSGTDNFVPRFNGTSALENSIIYDNGTSVGINTTTPSYNLDINGNLGANRFYQKADGVPTNNLGDPTITEMALFDSQFDNKTAFYPLIYGSPTLIFETYNGSTWTDISSTISDTDKRRLFGGDNTSNIIIPNGVVQYQITISAATYVYLNALYNYWSSNGHNSQVQIWKKHNSGSWIQHTFSTATVSSWPGHLYLPFTTIPWHQAGSLGTHYNQVRIVYTPTWSTSFPTNNINLYKLQLWGGYPAGKRVVYSTDELRNVTFPSNLTSTTLISTQSTGTSPLTVNSTTLVSNLNADYLDGQHGSFYYPASNPNGYTTNTGTVTQVNSGNGMNFTNFTTSGTITMGTPSSTTLASTNATTTNSHTHAFAPGGTTAQYITGAGTLVTFPTIVNTFVTGATVNNSTYDLTLTRNDGVTIIANLGILATDVKVTGGTYNPTTGVVTFTNTTGGTFNVTGFSTGMTDTFVTGGTYAAGTATFTRSNGATFNVTGFNTGTVTSVAALTLGTSGTDLNSTVANGTTTPVITLNVPDASATARGVITTGVQTIAGVKTLTSQLNGTVANFSQSSAGTSLTGYNGGVGGTGVSGGAANGIGGYFVNNSTTNPVVRLLGLSNTRLLEGRNTSDIATFSVTSTGIVSGSSFVRIGGTSTQFLKADGTVDSTTYVPTSRTITINGVAQDLSVNRSWTIATGGFTGGTVTGATNFTGGLTANTISATTVTANNFTGLASLATSATTALNATNAANIFTTNLPTTDTLAYPTFVTGFGSNRVLYVDSSTLTYNPSSNILTLVNLVASGAITATTVTANNFTGLASLATSATTALNATNATTTDKIDNINFRNSDQTSPISAPDTLDSNGVGYVTNINLYGQIDGALYAQAYSSAWQHQIFGDYRTGQLAVRGKNSGTWQSWRNILDSTNFTNYAVPTGRTLTINGTTFDLSANRSWTITSGGFTGGTVTGPTNFTAGVTANTISATTVTIDTLNVTSIPSIAGLNNYVSKFTVNGTGLGNSQIYDNGTSVGINTTSPNPSFKLDVNGATSINGPLSVSGSPTTLQYVRVNSDMDLFNSHVDSENYGTFSRLRLSRASGTQIAPTTPASGTAVGRLEFGAYNSGTGTFIMNAKVEAVMDATTGANDLPSRLSFFTTPDGSTTMAEVMRVNSLGNMRIGGLTMALSDVINVENGSVAFQNGYGLRFQSTGGTLYASVYSNNNDTVIKSLGDAIRFKNRTGTANRMSILDGGFVGINTNTPNQWLDVNGDALINGLTVGLGNSAYNNAVLGNQALGANTTGYNNVAIHSALPLNTTGTNNVGVGYKALFINTIGNDNVAVGVGSLQLNTSGEKNISIGSNSSYNNDNGQANIAIGANALFTNVNSSSNVAVGYNALYTNTGGANLALGHYAGYTLDGDGNNIIGTSNNQLPDANDLSNQSNTLSISKHTQITKGMPHFWAPDSISISPGAGYVLEADPLAYSAVFIDYSLEDQNGNLRAGTLKAIFNVTLATIKWDEVATSDIGSTSNYTFDFMDNGSGILGVELTNSGGVTVYCNLTSRLVSRTIL